VTCRIINNIHHLLQAVAHSIQVTDHCLTETLWGVSHLFLVTTVDTTTKLNWLKPHTYWNVRGATWKSTV